MFTNMRWKLQKMGAEQNELELSDPGMLTVGRLEEERAVQGGKAYQEPSAARSFQ